uniref:HTH CENPB-type domain-containing protein n=1 Tax=Ditylenchus dipsaci TaxID=166011 RepID=A0A915E7M2_9BILA
MLDYFEFIYFRFIDTEGVEVKEEPVLPVTSGEATAAFKILQGARAASKKARKLKSYTVAFKLEAIDHAKKVSVSSASKKFSVSRGCIQNWKNKRTSYAYYSQDSSPAGKAKKKLPGGGRPLTFKELDNELAIWVRERRANKLRVSTRIIQQQGERMFNAEEDEGNFKTRANIFSSHVNMTRNYYNLTYSV